MTRTGKPHIILAAIAMLLTACPSDSPSPAQAPNIPQPSDAASSGTVPSDAPKPTPDAAPVKPAPAAELKIVVPGMAEGSIPVGEQGKPYSLSGIKITGGGTITIVDCLPTKNGGVTAANDGTYTLNITSLPDQEVKCTLQAKNDTASVITVVTIPVNTPPPAVLEVVVNNVPASISITGETSTTIDNIYISGFVPNTVGAITCKLDKTASIKQVGDANSPMFQATITAQAGTNDGSNDDDCVISAKAPNGKSGEAKFVLHSLPAGKKAPSFTPNNFKAGDVIPLVAQGWLGYYSMIDAKAYIYPRIDIFDPDGVQSVTANCTNNNKLGFVKASTQLIPGTTSTYQMVAQYTIGNTPAGGFVTENCTLTATDKTGLLSTYELTLKPQ